MSRGLEFRAYGALILVFSAGMYAATASRVWGAVLPPRWTDGTVPSIGELIARPSFSFEAMMTVGCFTGAIAGLSLLVAGQERK